MLTQRSEGLRRLLLICQIWITAGLFWLGVWVMVKFYSPPGGLTWRRWAWLFDRRHFAGYQNQLHPRCNGV